MMTAVAGFFGMNLHSGLQDEPGWFGLITGGSILASLLVFGTFVSVMYRRGMLVL
jgi:Mg2+ and Co2+ transporter CorA